MVFAQSNVGASCSVRGILTGPLDYVHRACGVVSIVRRGSWRRWTAERGRMYVLQSCKPRRGAPCIGKGRKSSSKSSVFAEGKVEAMVAAIRVLMCLPCISWWSRRANEGHLQLACTRTIAVRLHRCPTRSQRRIERCQWLAAS